MAENARLLFARNLTRLMEGAGCTQADLIRELGLRQSTVSDWMSGKKYPRVDKIQLLADFFGVARTELTEEQAAAPRPGTTAWLREGLAARGIRAGHLSDGQLETLLENLDLLARAFGNGE